MGLNYYFFLLETQIVGPWGSLKQNRINNFRPISGHIRVSFHDYFVKSFKIQKKTFQANIMGPCGKNIQQKKAQIPGLRMLNKPGRAV